MRADRGSGDVDVTDALDGLAVRPRTPADGPLLLGALRAAAPFAPLRRSAGGIVVPPGAAGGVSAAAADLKWSAAALRYVENRDTARRVHGRLVTQVRALRDGGAEEARKVLGGVGEGVLDGHQEVNVAAMTLPGGPGLCVFDEQGAGKTVTMIYAFDALAHRDEADFALIVAPKSMVAEWPKDFARFMGDLYQVRTVAGPRPGKLAAIGSGADVLVTNFETVVSMEPELEGLLRSKAGRAVLVVDESFHAKSLDAQRTRALRRLREWCGRAYVLCGTPAPNAPQDLVQQFNLVDFGMAFDGVEIPEDREEAAPVVQAAIDERGLYVRHLKSEVLPDLPGKRFHRISVPLQPKQRRLYEGALRDLILDVEKVDDTSFSRKLASFLARRSALLQICSSPASVAPGYDEVPAKLAALDSLLDGLVLGRNEKVVLWSFYTDSIDAMMARYGRLGAVRYDGAVHDIGARREAVRRFQDDDATMVFVANPAAAGAGLTLHRARYAVYESMSNQAAHYLQSLDRIHRRGQERAVEYYVLLCEGTIEEQEHKRLMRKERAAQHLLGDIVGEPVTRDAFLADVHAAAELLES